MALNKIYSILIFIFAVQSYAQTDSIDNYYWTEHGFYDRVAYSVLFDVDKDTEIELSKADSLTQAIIKEIEKIKLRKVLLSFPAKDCYSDKCDEREIYPKNCNDIIFPNKLFLKLSQNKQDTLKAIAKKSNLFLTLTDSLYEDLLPNDITKTRYVIHAKSGQVDTFCSIYFSSKKSVRGEQVILINGVPYRIAKKKDGSTVLRTASGNTKSQIGICDGYINPKRGSLIKNDYECYLKGKIE